MEFTIYNSSSDPVTETEVADWLRKPHPEPFTEWSNPQGSRTTTGNQLHGSHPLRTGHNTLGTQYTPPSTYVGDHIVVGFVSHPWLVWDQGLTSFSRLITKVRLTL